MRGKGGRGGRGEGREEGPWVQGQPKFLQGRGGCERRCETKPHPSFPSSPQNTPSETWDVDFRQTGRGPPFDSSTACYYLSKMPSPAFYPKGSEFESEFEFGFESEFESEFEIESEFGFGFEFEFDFESDSEEHISKKNHLIPHFTQKY